MPHLPPLTVLFAVPAMGRASVQPSQRSEQCLHLRGMDEEMVMVRQYDPSEDLLGCSLIGFKQLRFEFGHSRRIQTDDGLVPVACRGDQVHPGSTLVMRWAMPGQLMTLSVLERLLSLFRRHFAPTCTF